MGHPVQRLEEVRAAAPPAGPATNQSPKAAADAAVAAQGSSSPGEIVQAPMIPR